MPEQLTPPTGTPTPTPTDPPSLVSGGTPPAGQEGTPPAPQSSPPAPETPPVLLTEADIKLPDGLTADKEVLGKFLGIANDAKLTPAERANALINLQHEAMTKAQEADSKAFADMQTKWREETMADPEIGGQNWTKNQSAIGKLLDQFGSPEVRQAFDYTGAGNNPHIVRMLAKIAAQLTEPVTPVSGQPVPPAKSPESTLYDKGT